jgi:CRP/FNR family transcriptional regulator
LPATARQRDRFKQAFPFVAALPPSLRQAFFSTAVLTRLPQAHPICQQGAACSHLALVLSGSARVYKIGENGRDITLYRVGAGESCILTASCILSQRAFPAFATCEEAVEAVLLSSSRVREWADLSPIFRDYLFGLMAQRLGNLMQIVEEVVFRRLDHRLATYLLQRVHQTTSVIRTTHQEIASDLGSSREVISRLLKDFENHHLIQIARGEVRLLDAAGLRDKATST